MSYGLCLSLCFFLSIRNHRMLWNFHNIYTHNIRYLLLKNWSNNLCELTFLHLILYILVRIKHNEMRTDFHVRKKFFSIENDTNTTSNSHTQPINVNIEIYVCNRVKFLQNSNYIVANFPFFSFFNMNFYGNILRHIQLQFYYNSILKCGKVFCNKGVMHSFSFFSFFENT